MVCRLGVPVARFVADRQNLAMKFSEFEMKSITGEPVSFAQFDGKVALLVNVASF